MGLIITHTLGVAAAGLTPLRTWEGNLLREQPGPELASAGPVACWSGWAGAQDAAPGRFPVDAGLWGPQAWEQMLVSCRRAREAGVRLVLRPHARHVLSDAQRCVRFLEEGAAELLLEPAVMLTAPMLGDAAEHLERTLGALTGGAGVWGALLTGAEPVPGGEGELCPCPLTRGVLAPETLLRAAARWLGAGSPGAGRPVAILADDAAAQLALLQRLSASATLGPTEP